MPIRPNPARASTPSAPGATAPPGGSENLVRGIGLYVVMSRINGVTEPGILASRYMFQCPPLDTFHKVAAYSHLDFDTVRYGQYSRKQGVQLRTVTFDTLILSYTPSWTNISPDPENWSSRFVNRWKPNIHAMCDELEAICRSGTPFHLHAYQPGMWPHKSELEYDATLRQIDIEQRAGEPETRYISAAFTEWRKIGVNEKNKGPTGTSPAGRTVGTAAATKRAGGNKGVAKGNATRYVQASGLAENQRTLYDLSKQAYGTTTEWQTIVRANPVLNGLPPSGDILDFLSQDVKILLPQL